MIDHDDVKHLLGSYVLGGLEDDERRRVAEHLRSCEPCRQAHGQLAGLPALLDLVEPARAADAAPSSGLERAVLAGFADQHEPRGSMARPIPRRRLGRLSDRWRSGLAGAFAGAAFTLAALAAGGVFSSGSGDERTITMVSPSGGSARAVAELISGRTGTYVRLDAALPPLRPGEVYELWFVQGNAHLSAGTFTVGEDGQAEVRLSTAARRGSYERIGITREPDAADPARNGDPVVVGTL